MSSPGGDGFTVDPEELRAFAKGLNGRQDQIEAAAQKAGGVNLGADTFGVLLGFFPNDADAKAQEMMGHINELAAAVDAAANDVRVAADEYQNTDSGNAGGISSAGGM